MDTNVTVKPPRGLPRGGFNRSIISAAICSLVHSLGVGLFPSKCVACGRLFHRCGELPDGAPDGVNGNEMAFTRHMSPYFCSDCRRRWTPVDSPMCFRCGMVFTSREGEDHLCGRCIDCPGAFTKARAAGIYDSTLRTAIHALKFKGKVILADPLGGALYRTFRHYWKTERVDVVAPVPLHPRRFRQRGFNQAYLLLRRWTVPTGTTILRELLVRTRDTPFQTGLDRSQRRVNIKNAFYVKHPGQIAGKQVLLVDDVLTTGATADACAGALIQSGANRVDVLTLARAL